MSQRYIFDTEPWLTLVLSRMSREGGHNPEFTSLLYLLYALTDRLAFEFVTNILCSKDYRTRPLVTRNEVLDLLDAAIPSQPQINRWTETTRIKLASIVLTALRDFGVLAGKQKKTLVQPPLPLSTAEAILRILISEGYRGRQVLENHTWRLFLLTETEVAQLLGRLAQAGTIRFEKVGSTVVLETPVAWEMPL